ILPRSPDSYAAERGLVADQAGAEALLDFARQRPIAFIGIDCEYRYSRPGVFVRRSRGEDRFWYDPHSLTPLLLAVVLSETRPDGQAILYRFVVDLRQPGVLGPLGAFFRLPVPFVAHFAQAELFCLWKLALPTPDAVWDTCLAERAFQLGVHHPRYRGGDPEDEVERARSKEEAEAELDFSCSLVATCLRRGVPYPFAATKDRLRGSFWTHPADQPFSPEQQAYAAADAEAAARLYPIQVQAALAQNALNHLQRVEMDWTVTNARIIWDGVRVDPALCERLLAACRRHARDLPVRLAAMGLGNVNSHPQLKAFFRSLGLLDAFRAGAKYTFDDDHLEAVEGRHAAVPLIRTLRKARRLLADRFLLTGALVGADGRLHPEHRQLGAESGRNTMSNPNVGGLDKALRPLVVPSDPATHAVGEVDLSQIEVGVAAALFADPDLVAMFNQGDVYSMMARRYYADLLPSAASGLPDREFKQIYRSYRDRMKVFTLAIIYNITAVGLARQLGIGHPQAAREREKFLALFPSLVRALGEASAYGALRGYAELCTGLRRYRARAGAPTPWEVNWLRNTPVQGSAGVVFKVAGNRLRRRYAHYGAKIILCLHDAFVFEVPYAHLEEVAEITSEVMRGAVQESFPALRPQVDVNVEHPQCWNKDGKHLSLEYWMEDPERARTYLGS
ncbi:MAG: hypothetical protein JO116_23425, partial [Planctomycetaceae bacterium]|nr:hypothetical protein [Planctomycetaceae bacterium]